MPRKKAEYESSCNSSKWYGGPNNSDLERLMSKDDTFLVLQLFIYSFMLLYVIHFCRIVMTLVGIGMLLN